MGFCMEEVGNGPVSPGTAYSRGGIGRGNSGGPSMIGLSRVEDGISGAFAKPFERVYPLETLYRFGPLFFLCQEMVLELLIDPVDKLPATDDAAVDEVPRSVPEPIEFIEFKVSLPLFL